MYKLLYDLELTLGQYLFPDFPVKCKSKFLFHQRFVIDDFSVDT